MTDFDAKLAELEANSDRVPELKIVVELFKLLHLTPDKWPDPMTCTCDECKKFRREMETE